MGAGELHRLTVVALGALLAAVGFIVMVLPIPIPLIGSVPFALGCALLSANSHRVRRWIQGVRYRFASLSDVFERLATRAPAGLRRILERTRPNALARQAKMAARHSGGA
jgi:hypothetical protein